MFTFLNAMFRNVAALRILTRLVELDTPRTLKANSVETVNKK